MRDEPGEPETSPLYEQVKQEILKRIARGEWAAGDQVPTEHALTASLGVSRMTVHRALRELSAEGYISRFQGVGSFVAEQRPRLEWLGIRDIAEDIARAGHRHGMEIITHEAVHATPLQAMRFDKASGARLFHTVILHFEDDLLIQLEDCYVSPRFAPKATGSAWKLSITYTPCRRLFALSAGGHLLLSSSAYTYPGSVLASIWMMSLG